MNFRRSLHPRMLSMVLIIAIVNVGLLLVPAHLVYAAKECRTSTNSFANAGDPYGVGFAGKELLAGDTISLTWGPAARTSAQLTLPSPQGPVAYPGPIVFTAPSDGVFKVQFQINGGGTGPISVTVVICSGSDSVLPLPLFTDGRENKNDALQTAAVYCGVPHDGDVRIYALFNNVGSVAFTVTKAELAAGVQKPATPYLIKSGKGAELYRLQDGSLRIKRGTYVFDWPGC